MVSVVVPTVKRLVVEQGSNELGVASFNETASYQVFLLKLRVAKHKLNLELRSSKKFAESKFETASY